MTETSEELSALRGLLEAFDRHFTIPVRHQGCHCTWCSVLEARDLANSLASGEGAEEPDRFLDATHHHEFPAPLDTEGGDEEPSPNGWKYANRYRSKHALDHDVEPLLAKFYDWAETQLTRADQGVLDGPSFESERGVLEARLADEEKQHGQAIAERDGWERWCTEAAQLLGCEEEWSSHHDHRLCVFDNVRIFQAELAEWRDAAFWLCAGQVSTPATDAVNGMRPSHLRDLFEKWRKDVKAQWDRYAADPFCGTHRGKSYAECPVCRSVERDDRVHELEEKLESMGEGHRAWCIALDHAGRGMEPEEMGRLARQADVKAPHGDVATTPPAGGSTPGAATDEPLPCPNPECERLEGPHIADAPKGEAVIVLCPDCGMWGPDNTFDDAEAIRLWNALPRQQSVCAPEGVREARELLSEAIESLPSAIPHYRDQLHAALSSLSQPVATDGVREALEKTLEEWHGRTIDYISSPGCEWTRRGRVVELLDEVRAALKSLRSQGQPSGEVGEDVKPLRDMLRTLDGYFGEALGHCPICGHDSHVDDCPFDALLRSAPEDGDAEEGPSEQDYLDWHRDNDARLERLQAALAKQKERADKAFSCLAQCRDDRHNLQAALGEVTKERDDALADLREPHKERALDMLYQEGCEGDSDTWDEMAERIITQRDQAQTDLAEAEKINQSWIYDWENVCEAAGEKKDTMPTALIGRIKNMRGRVEGLEAELVDAKGYREMLKRLERERQVGEEGGSDG